jgi:hypothetical protein
MSSRAYLGSPTLTQQGSVSTETSGFADVALVMANARLTETNRSAIHGSSQRALLRLMRAKTGDGVMAHPLQGDARHSGSWVSFPSIGRLPGSVKIGRLPMGVARFGPESVLGRPDGDLMS